MVPSVKIKDKMSISNDGCASGGRNQSQTSKHVSDNEFSEAESGQIV
jgi:hypothetical protein